MNKLELVLKVAQLLMDVVKNIRTLADSVEAVCAAVTDGLPETETPALPEKKEESAVPLERVRSVLAVKSREGYTAEVRAIITKHGANRLSEIDPAEYADVLKEAEVLGNAG